MRCERTASLLAGPRALLQIPLRPTDPMLRGQRRKGAEPVTIEDDVRLGQGVTVGAGSVVISDVPAGVVALEGPVKVIRSSRRCSAGSRGGREGPSRLESIKSIKQYKRVTRRPNPFTPTAGAVPPLLVGRDLELDEVVASLEDGVGAPGRLTMVTGARGVGKTVLLTEIAARAQPLGWVVVDETATPGLVGRIDAAVARTLDQVDAAGRAGRSVTGITLPSILGTGGGAITLADRSAAVVGLRERIGLLLDVLEPHGGSLMITVDEVHAAGRDELRELGTTFQHLVRERREVALITAGLPAAVSDLLNDDVLTFLRRAYRVALEDVPLDLVRDALRTTIESSGRTIGDDALQVAAEATGGYPFMVQLVGHQVWRAARTDAISMADVEAALPAARVRLGSTVHASALSDVSAVDRTYLLAMAEDDEESSTGDIAARMGVGPRYANVYRSRLIDAGLVTSTRWGHVTFAIPHLRQYLREHAASIEAVSRRPGRQV